MLEKFDIVKVQRKELLQTYGIQVCFIMSHCITCEVDAIHAVGTII